MARLGAIGTGGNFTAAGTWGVIDTTAAWVIDSEVSTLSITNSTSTHISPSATPGAITIDGIYLKISSKSSSGTFTVVLRNTTAGSDVTSVVVDVADLPPTGWCFFKFSSSQLLLAATAYAIRVTCSVTTMVSLYRSTASAQEFTRLIRTTTTSAPGAGDQMIICKELTGQGTNSGTCTVTGNMTAATVYGATTYTDSLGIGGGGVFTWGTSEATNYLLTIAGLVTIWGGGTWNQGTSGTRMPSSSTAKLLFSVATNVDSGFVVKSDATVNMYGNIITADSTLMTVSRGGYCTTLGTAVTRVAGQSFTGLTGTIRIAGIDYTISSVTNSDSLVLTTSAGTQSTRVVYTHAATAATLTVASTSGWAANDILAVASTSRTAADSEEVVIQSVDSATQVTLTTGLTTQHSGDSPNQAEVIHVTRNVKIEGTSATLQGYITYGGTSVNLLTGTVINMSYVECKWLGSGTTAKRGIDCYCTTGSVTVIGCSFHDFRVSSSLCFNILPVTTANNVSITYTHFWNFWSSAIVIGAISGTNVTMDHCIGMKNSTSPIFSISDVGITFTNMTAVSGAASGAININESANLTGIFNNLKSHSCASNGITFISFRNGTISNVSSYKNSGTNLALATAMENIIIDNALIFGNATNNMTISACSNIVFTNGIFDGDAVDKSTIGLLISSGVGNGPITFDTCTFGVTRSHSTADISTIGTGNIICVNTILNSSTAVLIGATGFSDTQVLSSKHNQTNGLHKRWEKNGIASIDTTTYRTTSPSETLTPNSTSYKFRSSDTQPVAIDNGQTATVTVYVYKSATYSGNQPRLIVRRNNAIGITSDTVLATCVGGTGSWIALSGTTAAATDDGAFVCYVDCDGTTGTVSVDDWSVA